jgi:transcriptional regulator with XRE-family HTH domain
VVGSLAGRSHGSLCRVSALWPILTLKRGDSEIQQVKAFHMPLEDEFCDILKKARTGHGLSVGDVSRMVGLPSADISGLERGEQVRDRAAVQVLAEALGLRAEPLAQIAIDKWEPLAQRQPVWIETVHGSIGGYGVQGYIVHDQGEAVVIDTAYNAAQVAIGGDLPDPWSRRSCRGDRPPSGSSGSSCVSGPGRHRTSGLAATRGVACRSSGRASH